MKDYSPPASLFRANDIRGIAGPLPDADNRQSSEIILTPEFSSHLGRALGTLVLRSGKTAIWLCRDARLSSPALYKAFSEGVLATGCGILDIGIGPTPLLCHAVATRPSPHSEINSGVMITASHNPPEHNGFKIIVDGRPFFGEALAELRQIILNQDYVSGDGERIVIDHQPAYLDDFSATVSEIPATKIVLDAANGAAGPLALAALTRVGVDIVPLFCEMDGRFPNHSPDTSNPENLHTLVEQVRTQNAFCGIALDGDGDRMVAVTEHGDILNADDLLGLFSLDLLARQPGAAVVFDVKTSRHLATQITALGGRPIMTRSGRSFIQETMFEQNAGIAGEFSSHFFFADCWYGADDGIYAAARLLEICHRRNTRLSALLKARKQTYATDEIYIAVDEDRKFGLVEEFISESKSTCEFDGANLVTIDGLRIEYPAGWALLRASNTSAAITLRFEADTKADLNKLISQVRSGLEKLEPSLDIGKLHVS